MKVVVRRLQQYIDRPDAWRYRSYAWIEHQAVDG